MNMKELINDQYKKQNLWCHSEAFQSTLSYHRFCVPNWVSKRLKAFSHAEDMKISAGGLQNTVSPLVVPEPGGGHRGEALGNSAYLTLFLNDYLHNSTNFQVQA